MFSVLLRHWRTRRGLSQLDLALTAGVSARHVSFLETGRSRPGEGMVLRLGSALDVPLRDQNRMLEAAGFAAMWQEQAALPPVVAQVLERMLVQQEPYPLVVLDGGYGMVRANEAAHDLFAVAVDTRRGAHNLLELLFDPAGLRPWVVDWDTVGARLLARLEREVALGRRTADALLDRLRARAGDLPRSDPTRPVDPTLTLRLRLPGHTASFVSTLTVFSAPQQAWVQELLIESFFPLDAETEAGCRARAANR
jgi:transcriptional regulator with XRE-family HTH domain